MTVHEFITLGWEPPHELDRILSLTQVRYAVIVVTEWEVWRAIRDYNGDLKVELIAHFQ